MPPLDADHMLDALLTLPRLYGGTVSPDGRWVAWVWSGLRDVCDVYVAPVEGSSAPIQMTQDSENSQFAAWTPDSRALLVIQDDGGDECFRVYRVPLDQPGTMELLFDPGVQHYVRYPQMHPNGRWLIYGANYDVDTKREIDPYYIYRHDLITGERLPLAKPQVGGWCKPELNLAGTHIIYNRQERHPAGAQLWLVDIDGRDDHEIINTGDSFKVDGAWLSNSQQLLVIAEKHTHNAVGIYDLATDQLRWLIDDPARNLEWGYAVPRRDQAVILETREARTIASLMDVKSGAEWRLPTTQGNLTPLAPIDDGNWMGVFGSAQHPTDLVRFHPGNTLDPESFVSLTRLAQHTRLGPHNLIAAEEFCWEGEDGLPLQGWLYRPHAAPKGTIVCVHGGPALHDEDLLDDQVQYFAAQGFTVFQPNYRGSTGFSRAFVEAIKLNGWGRDEQDDIRAGIRALLQAGIAQPGKVGVTGLCYGGYSAWCQITRNPTDIVAAAVPVCGMTDLVIDYENTRSDLLPYTLEMMGGSPAEVPQKYVDASPINFVHQIKGRLLIVQGLNDPVVSPVNMRQVTRALDAVGIPYEMMVFDDEGHGIYRPANLRRLYPAMLDFFTRAFAGTPAPATGSTPAPPG
jgi:dipeptidyl aminopeptidase/acylaminoacyl peptidase